MDVVERRLEVAQPEKEDHADPPVNEDERARLLELAAQLSTDGLSVQKRLGLVEQMYRVLNHGAQPEKRLPTANEGETQPRTQLRSCPAFPG
jgi:hypothetical protein